MKILTSFFNQNNNISNNEIIFQSHENAKMTNVGDDRQTDEQANNYFPK